MIERLLSKANQIEVIWFAFFLVLITLFLRYNITIASKKENFKMTESQ